MPPLAEKSLTPEAAADIIEKAEALRDNKLFSLEELAELLSLNLEQATMLLAPFAVLLGIDLDLDTTNTHFNPAEPQQVRLTFGDSDKVCPGAPAEEAPDLNAVLGGGAIIEGVDIVYADNADEGLSDGQKTALKHELDTTFLSAAENEYLKEHEEVCPRTQGPHRLQCEGTISKGPYAGQLIVNWKLVCIHCHQGLKVTYETTVPRIQ